MCRAEAELQAGLRRQTDAGRGERLELHVAGEVRPAIAKQVADEIHARPHVSLLDIFVDSGGGWVIAGLEIIAALRGSRAKVTAYVRRAGSAAHMITLGCKNRVALPNAEFLHHDPNSHGKTRHNTTESQILGLINRLLAEAGCSPETAYLLRERGEQRRSFYADEALAAGIVQRVESFTFPPVPPYMRDAWQAFDEASGHKKHERTRKRAERRRPAVATYRGKRYERVDAGVVTGLAARLDAVKDGELVMLGISENTWLAAEHARSSGELIAEWPL